MLSTILLLLAFQAPAPAASDWPDPATAARYYEALHALEVDGLPNRAADLFARLSAAILPGNPEARAIATAQAARAAMAGGQEAMAERLQTDARNLSQGQPFEDRIRTILAQGAAARPAPTEKDENFSKLVWTLLLKDDYAQVLPRYGRRIVPYLVRFLAGSPPWDVYQKRNGGFPPVDRALEIWIQVGTPESVQNLGKALSHWDAENLSAWAEKVFQKSQPQDETARKAVDRFLLDMAADSDLGRAQWAVNGISDQLKFRKDPDLEQATLKILMSQNDLLAPALVGILPVGAANGDPKAYLDFWRKAARSPNPRVATRARFNLIRLGDTETLIELAKNGSADDRLRLGVLFGGWDPYQRSGLMGIDHRLGGNAYGELSKGLSFTPEQHGPLLVNLLKDEDPLVRRVAATAVSHRGYNPGLKRALQSPDPDVRSIAVSRVVHEWTSEGNPIRVLERIPPDFDQDLFGMLDDPGVGNQVLGFLANWGVGLSLEQLHEVEKRLGTPIGVQEEIFEEWCKTKEGREKTARWVQDPSSREASTRQALKALAEADPSYSALGIGLLDPDKDRVWNDRFLQVALNKWLPFLQKWIAETGTLDEKDNKRLLKLATYLKKIGQPHLEKGLWKLLGASLKASVKGIDALVQEMASSPESALWEYKGLTLGLRQNGSGTRTYPGIVDFFVYLVSILPPGDLLPNVRTWLPTRDPNSKKALPALLKSRDEKMVGLAYEILGKQPQAVSLVQNILWEFLADSRWASEAASALVLDPGKKDLVPALLEAWKLPGLQSRHLLLKAMGRTLDDRVIPVLLEALSDPDDLVASAADAALKRIRTVREQRQAFEVWQLAGGGLSPVAALLKKLRSPKTEVRVAAIQSLGTLGAKEALPFLVDLLEDPDAEIVAAARKALARINGAEETSGGKK